MEGSHKKPKTDNTTHLLMNQLLALVKQDDLPGLLALIGENSMTVIAWDNALIRAAAAHGAFNVTKWLLQQPEVDPNTANLDPIKRAIAAGHEKIVRLFLKCDRVTLTYPRSTSSLNKHVLWTAFIYRRLKILKMLLNNLQCISLEYFKSPFDVRFKTTGAPGDSVEELQKYLHGHWVWTDWVYMADPRILQPRPNFWPRWELGVTLEPPEMTFGRKDWKYFPRKRRRVYLEFLCCLRYLNFHRYFRDLHDTVMPYYFQINGGVP